MIAHNSIQNASTSVLEHLLDHDTCDVDPRNRLNGDTPLHLAIRGKWEDHEGLRVYLGKLQLLLGIRTISGLCEHGPGVFRLVVGGLLKLEGDK
jgi:hypothetical protein